MQSSVYIIGVCVIVFLMKEFIPERIIYYTLLSIDVFEGKKLSN